MPVKRRKGKARMTPEHEMTLWGDYWTLGVFLLAGQDDGGAPNPQLYYDWDAEQWRETDEYRRFRANVIDLAAREAWDRLGAEYLAQPDRPGTGQDPRRGDYALRKFGEPSNAR